jgi:D-sedoheptulose 7-phosphate isomerase
MDRKDLDSYVQEGLDARKNLDLDLIYRTGVDIGNTFNSGNKIMLFGNGGSAADAQHIAAEFVGHFERERRAIPALALTVNTSSLTAISNDYSYDHVFARQVEAFASPGDIVIGISTSGNSRNVIEGLKTARNLGCRTIGMTGLAGGKMAEFCDSLIMVKSSRTSLIQECHITIGHMWSKIAEDMLSENNIK